LRYQGNLDGALQAIQQTREIAESAVYPNEVSRTLDTSGVLLRQGLILGENDGVNLDRPEDALEPLQKAFDMVEGLARKDPSDSVSRSRVGNAGIPLGNVLRGKDPKRALELYDVAISRLAEIRNSLPARRDQAIVLADSSYVLRSLHRPSEAKQRIDQAEAILKDTQGLPSRANQSQ
jgi:hypothetical protein